MDPLLVYALIGMSILLSAVAAAGAWRRPQGASPLTEAHFEERLSAFKGGLVRELGRTRASVEAGMRDAHDAYDAAQQKLSLRIDEAVARLRAELMEANAEGIKAVEVAMGAVFEDARRVQELALGDQAMLLRDLKLNYERATADLRAAVSQASARQMESLRALSEAVRENAEFAGPVRATLESA